MNNYKFRIRDEAEYNRVIGVLQGFYPEVKQERDLRYDICNTKYLYLTNGVISTGFNMHAFKTSDNILIDLDNLFTMPANLNTKEVEPEEGVKAGIPQLNEIMIDIETLGTKPGYVILSIGAVFFDMKTGLTGDTFYKTLSLESSMQAGFKIDPKTLLWWSEQDKGAYHEALAIGVTDMDFNYDTTIRSFREWIENTAFDISRLQVWGNSARFDLGMLETYFNSVGTDVPWMFFNERDVRTLVSFAPEVKNSFVFDEDGNSITSHKAIGDCMNQIKYCSAIFNKLST